MGKRIRLTKGYEATVDDGDYDRLAQYSWWYHPGGYAKTEVWDKDRKRSVGLYMHRLITNCPPDKQVDHINGNGLDNRKENLRVCSQYINQQNRTRLNKNNKSGFRGVSWENRRKHWVAQSSINGCHKHLGSFNDPAGAREAVLHYENSCGANAL